MKKMVSWNVNGIRACIEKGFLDVFSEMEADIFCIQESKVSAGQLELDLIGYYDYWNYADKKGYSGVAMFTKEKPIRVSYGIGIDEHDHEGRVITAEFEDFYMLTCYECLIGPMSLARLCKAAVQTYFRIFRFSCKNCPCNIAKPCRSCGMTA